MINLETLFAGLTLKNPIIIGASNLVTDMGVLNRLEKAGAAAVVYKSLFEEQIQLETFEMDDRMNEYSERNAEMISLFPDIEHAGPAEFLHQLEEARKVLSIPLIASLNCVYDVSWVDYAVKLEKTGVNALELNFYAIPRDFDADERQIVQEQIQTLQAVIKAVNIPVIVKLSPFYTNILKTVKEMAETGAQGLVLFNRLFQPDINIDKEEHYFPYNLSHKEENRLALRFAGLLYGQTKAGICSTGGIFNGKDVIKLLLAGADCVQVVSTIYQNKPEHVESMLSEILTWMEGKKYRSLADFRGKLSNKNLTDPFAYKRAQYVDILMKSNDILKKYPMR
jgi:dihydroorotate dehydrogenase (fumarate)